MTTIAILLIVLGGGAIWWRNHKRKSAADEAMPVGQETLANRFPGFEIAPQDFVAIDGQLHRVNSDGSRHSLKEWHFDRATGEFYRITGEDRDSVYFDQMRYSERLIDVRRGKDGQAIVKIQLAFFRLAAMAILGLAILSMGVVGATGDGRRVAMEEILANITIGVGGGVAILYWTYKQARKVIPQFLMKNLIGPEPLNPLPSRAPVYQQPAASPDNAASDYSGKMS